eukprot:4619701-Pleurochrysis_carterae.AAC.5
MSSVAVSIQELSNSCTYLLKCGRITDVLMLMILVCIGMSAEQSSVHLNSTVDHEKYSGTSPSLDVGRSFNNLATI